MSIKSRRELQGMQRASEAVAVTLRKMREYARPGISAGALDDFGAGLLAEYGARSAPRLTYGFPGETCISVNREIAHGVPARNKILQEGDLVNIDVSAELDGFWSDNGGSFIVGRDLHRHQPLVDASRRILHGALGEIKDGVKISAIGKYIETTAKSLGFSVIRNLAGHGVGRSLHEEPLEILNCYDPNNHRRFRKNSVVAIETFISTTSNLATTLKDGWTLVGNKGGFVAQHEHTIVVTDGAPVILTHQNAV